MKKTLVLAEKPSVGKDIARVLDCKKSTRTFIEGNKHIVSWAMGHLVELARPEDYKPEWQGWNIDALPMLPERMQHKVIRRTKGQFMAIKNMIKRGQVGDVVIATDAGREGELVARWILRLAGWKGKTSRLWISSQTDAAIKQGFANLRDAKEYINLMRAAESRAEADWILGLNLTRALSCKYDVRLSAGRVQTPTLRLIADRDKKISQFTPKDRWKIDVFFDKFKSSFQPEKGDGWFYSEKEASEVFEFLKEGKALVKEVKKKKKILPPPHVYDLTALQRDANGRFGYSAKKTLQLMQSLYERHKLLSYPRTDSRFISKDIIPTLPDRLKGLMKTNFKEKAHALLNGNLNTGKHLVDDSKVSDHHGIIPTEEAADTNRLSTEEHNIWSMVVNRFIEALGQNCEYEDMSVTLDKEGHQLKAKGSRVQNKGWKSDTRDLIPLPELTEGQSLEIKESNLVKSQTQPPAHYTEGTLLADMENPGKYIQDAELKKKLGNAGLGTPATRADIIEKLVDNYYIERKGNSLATTSRGKELLSLVPENVQSPALTAQWEGTLTQIAEGKMDSRVFSKQIRSMTTELIGQVLKSKLEYKPLDASSQKCPICGKPMITMSAGRGKTKLACYSISCGYEEEKSRNDGGVHKASRKEKALNRKLIKQYTDNSSDKVTLADLLKK